MAHAWLDSLSDDWVSQPGSDASADQLPPLPVHDDTGPHKRGSPSRIPKLIHSSKPAGAPSNINSPSVLSERSASDINISRRLSPSKLSQEVKFTSSNNGARVMSNESAGSVVHNEAAQPVSPEKEDQQTPEWKRRLVYGDMAYGEQKDLFCSAAAGLQDMFKPPPAPEPTAFKLDLPSEGHETTLPSSPPPYPLPVTDADLEEYADYDEEDFDYPADVTPSPSPRRLQKEIKYKLNESSPSADPRNIGIAEEELTPELDGQTEIYRDESCLTNPHEDAMSSRRPSGRSDIQNEDFSPILIGKHSDEQGKVDFAPLEVPVDQLWQKLERLRVNQMLLDSQADLQIDVEPSPRKHADPETTMDYMRNGGFINTRRGGRSGEGSFYNRGLSSEIGVDTSEMLPEESLQASTPKEFPSVRTWATKSMPTFESPETSALPKAPYPSPEKGEVDSLDSRAISGSPLKLFGPYDTFTNQTLLRRISQFEDRSDSQSRQASNSTAPDHAHQMQGDEPASSLRYSRRISQFGGKDLDGYEFTGDLSDEIFEDPDDVDKENVAPPDLSIPVYPFQSGPLYGDDSPESRSGLMVRRRRSKTGASTDETGAMEGSYAERDAEIESKRPRTSPSKDPTPKRRRTLHRTDIAFARESRQSATTDTSAPMSLTPGKKRKDALPGGFELADPSVLALRDILQPRSPGSSRRVSENLERSKKSALRSLKDEPVVASSDAPTETDRKPSIRTQDFVDQAAQIMAMIRNQVKPELGSLDESGEGPESGDRPASPADSYQDSTNEPFSRPPSREGKPSTWSPPRQEDPEVMDRLKRYQELSDMADIVSSSVRSMNLASNHVDQRAKLGVPIPVVGDVTSDLPNVRITSNPFQGQQNGLLGPDYPSNGSNRSASHSYPSASSSRGSESRRVIKQESVSHLIPDKVGSMCLDKDKKVWVKQKGAAALLSYSRSIPPSDDSEEDPFASIPDLSVDMTREMQNLRLVAAQGRDGGHEGLRPQVDEHMQGKSASAVAIEEASPGTKRRNLTISFSSPVASIIRDISPEDDSYEEHMDNIAEQCHDSVRRSPQGRGDGGVRFRQASSRYGSFIPRPVSRIDEQDEESTVELPHDDRQVSVVGDQSLVSHRTPNERQTSFSMILSQTPGNGALALVQDDSALIGQNVGKLSLSPLSEFTLNNPDQSFGFEVSYVMGHRHMATGDGSKKVLSMAIKELVERLGEAEPHEAFWEDVTALNLHDKRLGSLHMLDEFCGKLVTLDASENSLNHLDGVPETVRELKVSRNLLTELTSWDHLMNLQYVDISDNEVTSLSALKSLVHLRSIKADNNQLTSLDGLGSHNGLLSLRARNNVIEELDFELVQFDRLEELDLNGNCITSVHNLELLPALTRLKLTKNRLQAVPKAEGLNQVRHLDLSDNELTTLDIGGFPSLHSMHADRNYINTVSGFDRARRLDSLSLREQHGELGLDLAFLSGAYEVRKLFLSGNLLEEFSPQVDFLNLQLLELANCGLQALPIGMGQIMPNLRTLNINFNAVSDLSPLQFVPRLKKLLAAGNRLSDSTKVTQLLTEFPHLTQLDVRDNPATLGFYAPLQVLVPQSGSELPDIFLLPAADVARDEAFAARLDEGTRLRRRLHQVVLVANCRRLRVLDGLSIRRRDVLARDSLLGALIRDGLLISEEDHPVSSVDDLCKAVDGPDAEEDTITDDEARAQLEGEAEDAWQHNETIKSARWSKEDSFA